MAARRRSTPTPDVKASAQYVFRGTVTGAGASNLDGVPPEPSLAVVRVDQVLLAPPQVSLQPGQEVTVAQAEGRTVANGDQLVFYATSWHYGSTLGVQEIAREAVAGGTRSAAAASLGTDVRNEVVNAQLQAIDFAIAERVAAAELVVSGRVLSVRDLETVEMYLEGSTWREAEVWVASTLKGRPPPDLRVVFPLADKEHPGAPRLLVDQDGIWLLRRRRSDPAGWWAPDRLDFHAPSALERITALVGATS
jgi:hypothetical protein